MYVCIYTISYLYVYIQFQYTIYTSQLFSVLGYRRRFIRVEKNTELSILCITKGCYVLCLLFFSKRNYIKRRKKCVGKFMKNLFLVANEIARIYIFYLMKLCEHRYGVLRDYNAADL